MAGAAPENDRAARRAQGASSSPGARRRRSTTAAACCGLRRWPTCGARPSCSTRRRSSTSSGPSSRPTTCRWNAARSSSTTRLTETEKPVVLVDCPSAIDPVLAIFEVVSGDLKSSGPAPDEPALRGASPLSLDGHLLDVTRVRRLGHAHLGLLHADLGGHRPGHPRRRGRAGGGRDPGHRHRDPDSAPGTAHRLLRPRRHPRHANDDHSWGLESGMIAAAFRRSAITSGCRCTTPDCRPTASPSACRPATRRASRCSDRGRRRRPDQRRIGPPRFGQHLLPAPDRGRRRDRRHDRRMLGEVEVSPGHAQARPSTALASPATS